MCTELWCTKNARFISFSPSYVVGNRKWKQMLKLVDWSNKKLTPSLVPFCLSFYWSDSFPTLPHALKYLQKLLLDVDLRDMKGFFFYRKLCWSRKGGVIVAAVMGRGLSGWEHGRLWEFAMAGNQSQRDPLPVVLPWSPEGEGVLQRNSLTFEWCTYSLSCRVRWIMSAPVCKIKKLEPAAS